VVIKKLAQNSNLKMVTVERDNKKETSWKLKPEDGHSRTW